jgi:hypothetical protein
MSKPPLTTRKAYSDRKNGKINVAPAASTVSLLCERCGKSDLSCQEPLVSIRSCYRLRILPDVCGVVGSKTVPQSVEEAVGANNFA